MLWEHRTSGPKSELEATTARGLGSDGSRVFVGGTLPNAASRYEFLVLALDARSGELVWEDRLNTGGDIEGAYGIAVHGGRVFAHGTGGPQCLFNVSPPSDCDVLIRSYDASTGALYWSQATGVHGIDDAKYEESILARGSRLYVASAVNFPSADTSLPKGDWLVQAYRSSSGLLLWEDRLDTGGDSTSNGMGRGTAGSGRCARPIIRCGKDGKCGRKLELCSSGLSRYR